MPIDLDQARAARAEAQGTGPELVFGGHTFKLPPELPIDTLDALAQLDAASQSKDSAAITTAFRGIATSLVGEKNAAKFLAMQPSIQDMSALVDGIAKEYGFATVGESSASAKS